MSLESWKEEFYPVKASAKHSDVEAIKHAIQKWSGYSLENLKKHNIELKNPVIIVDDNAQDDFTFSTDTCSLCRKYWLRDCRRCPLYLIGESCLSWHLPDGSKSSYRKTLNSGDNSFILDALKKALIYVEENS